MQTSGLEKTLSKNSERGAGEAGAHRMAAISQAVESGRPLAKFFGDVSEQKANAVTRMVEAAAAIATATPPHESSSADGDPLMLAFAELGAVPWSEQASETTPTCSQISSEGEFPKTLERSVQPFLPAMYDRWEPPSHQRFLNDLQPQHRERSTCGDTAPKDTLRVGNLDDLDDGALARFPVLRSLRNHIDCPSPLGQIADFLYGMGETLTFISVPRENLDAILERVGTMSAVQIAMSFTPPDDAIWVDTTCNGRPVGLLVYRSHPGWLHVRRVELDETGAPVCLPVGVVRMQIPFQSTVDWHALESSGRTLDQAGDSGAAMALYHDTSSEALEPGIDRDAAEPFYGPRCLDLILVAVAASPLCR